MVVRSDLRFTSSVILCGSVAFPQTVCWVGDPPGLLSAFACDVAKDLSRPSHVLATLLCRQTNAQPPALWRGDSIAETHHDRVNTAPTELIHEWKAVYSLGVSRWRAFVSSRKAFAAGLGLKLLQAMYSTREGPSVIGSEVSGRVSGTKSAGRRVIARL